MSLFPWTLCRHMTFVNVYIYICIHSHIYIYMYIHTYIIHIHIDPQELLTSIAQGFWLSNSRWIILEVLSFVVGDWWTNHDYSPFESCVSDQGNWLNPDECRHIYIYLFICFFIYIFIFIYFYLYIYIHIFIFLFICLYFYLYVYICMFIFLYLY